MQTTPEQTNELIRKRRSIFPKTYTDEPIPRAILEDVLENANWAPTHKFTEPWRFKVFQGQTALNRLGEFLATTYKETTSEDRFSEMKYKKTLNKPAKCAAVIAICMHRDEEERIPEIEEVCAVSCAVQNMWLSAASYNIGAYWSSPKMVFSDKMKAFLGLGEKDKCLGLFYMGYHNMPELPGKRGSMSDKVEWIEE